jgi:hypothetical protein
MPSQPASGKSLHRIAAVETTSDVLSDRGGLALFVRYLEGIALTSHLERLFGSMRKSGKGVPIGALFRQLFCFFADGTSRHLVHFDHLKQDPGYAGVLETAPEAMASSHAVKRFFQGFSWVRIALFRRLLQHLFLWRLKREAPSVVVLGLDTMVLDNDEALCRAGVEPTYKRVKGFQPLQMTWGRFVIDARFRSGKKNSNHGSDALQMIRRAVQAIRTHYCAEVPIVLRMDGGFFDQKLFALCEALGIGYVCGGKILADLAFFVDEWVHASAGEAWQRYAKGAEAWEYLELGDCRGEWSRWRRALYTRPLVEGEQMLLGFARPEMVLYTNLGRGERIDTLLAAADHAHWTEPAQILELYHGRGADELVHRSLKEFRAEEMPFQGFRANAAFYFTMLVAFFLMECFKEDVCSPVVPITARATRLRREVLDIAAKLVRHAGRVVLKVTQATWQRLRLEELWQRCTSPPRFAWGG